MIIETPTLTRSQSRSFALAALMLCFVSGLLLMGTRNNAVVSVELRDEELVNLPSSSTISLRNFHRSESKEGELLWEIKANQGEYYPEKAQANLTQPALTFFDEEGIPMRLSAPKGTVLFQGQALDQAQVEGGAKIIHGNGVTVSSPVLVYKSNTSEVTSPTDVTIQGEGFVTSGHTLVLNTENHVTMINRNVKTVFSSGTK